MSVDRFSDLTRAVLANVQRVGFPPLHSMPVSAARQAYAAGVGAMSRPGPTLTRSERFSIAGPAGDIPVALWAPVDEPGLPVLVYLHGGGFVVGGLDTCEHLCREVAQQAHVAVLAVDYRLAPEHRYADCLADAWTALRWVAEHGPQQGLDSRRIALAGDSAGATLASVTALLARDAGIPVRLQALFYPSVQKRQLTSSFQAYSRNTLVNAELLAWFEAQSQGPLAEPWHREPLYAPSLAGVAPVWLGLAECDPLADDGRLYAEALQAAGVPVQVRVWDGVLHDFINMGRFLPEAAQAHTELAHVVHQALTA